MEKPQPPQLFGEFVSLLSLPELNKESRGRLASLSQNSQVIATLAEKYWSNNIDFLTTDETKRKILELDKYRIAAKNLIENYSGVAEPEISKMLETRFKFTREEIEGLDHKTISITYFELIGLLRGYYNDEAIGSAFRRPFDAFGGRSRLQLVKVGQSDTVIQHAISGLISQTT